MGAYVEIGGIQYPVVFDAPGETSNILQQQEITEPGLLKFYAVLEGDANPDRYITFENLIKYLFPKLIVRAGTADVVNGENSILFKVNDVNTPLTSLNYIVLFSKGYELGLSNVTKYLERFTVESIDAGAIDYFVILFT